MSADSDSRDARLAAALSAFEASGDDADLDALEAALSEGSGEEPAASLDRLDGLLVDLRAAASGQAVEDGAEPAPAPRTDVPSPGRPAGGAARPWGIAAAALALAAAALVAVWPAPEPGVDPLPALRGDGDVSVAAWHAEAERVVRAAAGPVHTSVLVRLHLARDGAVSRVEVVGGAEAALEERVAGVGADIAPHPSPEATESFDIWVGPSEE